MGRHVYDVVVIGAGVSGLTTGVVLAEAGLRVSIHTDAMPEQTAAIAAGAICMPFLVAHERVHEWNQEARRAFTELCHAGAAGVTLVSGVQVSRGECQPPEQAELLPDLRPCLASELPAGYASGWHYTAPLVDMHEYLPYLLARFTDAGGVVVREHLDSFDEAGGSAPIVVNCAGMGAAALGADQELYPVRGQTVVLTNPGITDFFLCDEPHGPLDLLYIYPHERRVVLGGVTQRGSSDLAPDPSTARHIIECCLTVEPRLASARVVAHHVGIRPARDRVRVEADPVRRPYRLLHNYGHGGSGVTLSWSCARDVAALVDSARSPSTPTARRATERRGG